MVYKASNEDARGCPPVALVATLLQIGSYVVKTRDAVPLHQMNLFLLSVLQIPERQKSQPQVDLVLLSAWDDRNSQAPHMVVKSLFSRPAASNPWIPLHTGTPQARQTWLLP